MTTPDPDLDDAALARLGHHELSAILASLYARLGEAPLTASSVRASTADELRSRLRAVRHRLAWRVEPAGARARAPVGPQAWRDRRGRGRDQGRDPGHGPTRPNPTRDLAHRRSSPAAASSSWSRSTTRWWSRRVSSAAGSASWSSAPTRPPTSGS